MDKSDNKVQNAERGARIQEERKRLGLTIVAMSQAAGVSKGSQILYEKGNPPTADYLGALLRLGADIHYILAGKRSRRISELAGQEALIELAAARGEVEQSARDQSTAAASAEALLREDFEPVPLHQVMLAAGPGATNSGEPVVAHLAFRRDWLRRIGVSSASARLARVSGDSMLPSISAGDMVLIDTSQIDIPVRHRGPADRRPAPIYALIEEGEARVKRVERPSEDQLLLSSDSPLYGPEIRQVADVSIIGKVVWWGHTVRE